jgi:hypothetical protein
VAQSPTPDDEIVRQMELLKDVDPDEVAIPEGKPNNVEQVIDGPDMAQQAQQAVARTGTNMLSPTDAPELFRAASAVGIADVVRLLEELPVRIAEELKRG